MPDWESLRAELGPIVDEYITQHANLVDAYKTGAAAFAPSAVAQMENGDEAESPAVDVTELEWVTPQQQELLETEVGPDSGDWRVWLPMELDSRWPEWISATPEELTKRLDTLIGLMAVPSSDALIEEADQIANKIDARLDDRPEIAEMMAEFSPEELTEILMEAFGTGNAA